MIRKFLRYLPLILTFCAHTFFAVGPIVPGQSLWCITKSIGSTIDIIESKVCNIDLDVSAIQEFLCSKLETLDSVVDIVEVKACEVESNISILAACEPTPFTAPTTITVSGFYCLSESNNTAGITVQANAAPGGGDVVVDLNGHRVQSIIIEQNDQVTFRNGTVIGDNMTGIAIDVQSGSINITLQDIVANNAEIGIQMTGVIGGLIENCSMSQNFTGVELSTSHKIVIDSSAASCNKNAGFCLLNSTTCCITNSKALSTGEGNNQTSDQTIFGFVSTDGYANVFENCIANGTQGLLVTDFDSLIAGFALRGSEGCTKIINCESANAISDDAGITIPYGILLESSLSTQLSLTGVPFLGAPTQAANSLDWSKDGKFLAVANSTNLSIYSYDSVQKIFTRIVTDDTATSAIDMVRWDPGASFIATAQDNGTLRVYQICHINNTLELVAVNSDSSDLNALDWHPNGSYIATGGADDTLRVYTFDRAGTSLALADSDLLTADIIDVAWNPDGNFIAVVGADFSGEIHVYPFSANTLGTRIDETSPTSTVNSIDWSADGKYFATGEAGGTLRIFEFDTITPAITPRDTVAVSGSPSISSVHWSSDTKFIALGADDDITRVFAWDRAVAPSQESLSSAAAGNVNDVRWAPDGQLIASAIENGADPVAVYEALSFPSKNVIKDNTVYCNSGNQCPGGFGISGSSIANLIIGNTAYANPISPPVIGTNYAFVTNVFNQLFGQGPTVLQNISVDACVPLIGPADIALFLKQAKYEVGLADSQLDVVLSKVCALQTEIDTLTQCDPTVVSTLPTTLSTEGFYCLANGIESDELTIDGNAIVVDMNGQTISKLTILNNDQVTVYGGAIAGTAMTGNAVEVTTATNITLRDLHATNAQVGINMFDVTGAHIDNCEMTLNFTGVELDHSHKIVIDNSVASCNKNAGYDLINSTTCCIRNSKALSMGEGNSETSDQTIFGFVSTGGYANIFENCIANGTQGLQVTDFDSLIAGFALRGAEGCSKIIACESANATSSVSGVTIPYGILLENSISQLTNTNEAPNPLPVADINSVDWSHDGKYLAVGGAQTNRISVYQFNSVTFELDLIAQATGTDLPTSAVNQVRWSHDGTFILAGDATTVYAYQLCTINNTLELVDTIVVGEPINSVSWRFNDSYVSFGVDDTGAGGIAELQVYIFDRAATQFTQLVTENLTGNVSVNSVAWRQDGTYIATGVSASPQLSVFTVDFSTPDITLDAGNSVVVGDVVNSVDWSPDGTYIAVGTATGSIDELRVYSFTPGTIGTAISVAVGANVNEVHWSSDGQYIVIATDAPNVQVYRFDRTTLALVATPDSGPDGATVNSVRFIPSGDFVATGADSTDTDQINTYRALLFPRKNVIKDNTVYCNSGVNNQLGIGISASSISNLIIGNTAYANPMAPPVGFAQNYAFITNVFNQLFGQRPSALQNISVDGCVPLTSPEDLALILKQGKYQVQLLDSQLDIVESKVCDVLTKIEGFTNCQPTPFTASTTITESGFYCLAENSNTGVITVQANIVPGGVVVDLNGHRVQAIVIEQNDQVTFRNGRVVGDSMTGIAIDVQDGSTNIKLQDVAVQNAELGIQMTGVVGATVENCSMSQNFTGIELSMSHKIVMDSCVASCNKNAGYCLLSSTTNCLVNCKALSTGEGNNETAGQTIFGFVSTDGYANIFENCIANGTQGLLVTDFDSLVAGFALRGSEGCTKIIECESANTQTDDAGVTVPYGILLEATIANPLSLTGVPFLGEPSQEVISLDWTSDGKRLATSAGDTIGIYSYDSVQKNFTRIALDQTATSSAVRWDAPGMYLATGDNDDTLRVYEFCSINNSLELQATLAVSSIDTLNWNSKGTRIATGGLDDTLRVIQFDRAALALSQLGSAVTDADINSVAWRPDDAFIVVGLADSATSEIIIYSIVESPFALISVATNAPGVTVTSVDWSLDGKFLVTGDAGGTVRIFEFDGTTLTPRDTVSVGAIVNSVQWSSDGRFIAAGADDAVVHVYYWDRANTPMQVSSSSAAAGNIAEISWAPDGQLIAAGVQNASDPVAVYEAFSFPSKNVIKDNTVYCNGSTCGIGASGSSIANLIIGNTAYANPTAPPIGFAQNYAFVTNVFNQLFGQGPSALQNISVDGCVPLQMPANLALILKQAQQKAVIANSQMDIVESKICEALSKIGDLGVCNPTPFTASTTIDTSGFYCLSASNNTGVITVQASTNDVVVDLNNNRVQAIVIEQNDHITFMNGTVIGDNMIGIAIDVQAGSSNITLQNVQADNAQIGIHFTDVTGGLIENCSMSLNFTGVELTSSHKIVIDNSVASCNKNAGYCLISSTTNCIKDSKALSTGEGNSESSAQTIFGFVSTGGYANIFENCIANGTQGLQIADYDSVIAGFALRRSGDTGITEGCSKIIGCESANATSSVAGVTVPYGILLEPTITQLTKSTQAPNPVPGTDINSVDWRLDGKYLAVGGGISANLNGLAVYSFDSVTFELDRIAQPTGTDIPSSAITELKWSPDGNFILAGDSTTVYVYELCTINNTLELVGTIVVGTNVNSVDWRFNGAYIAFGTGVDPELQVYIFDRAAGTFTLLAAENITGDINSVAWRADGTYIATGLDTADQLRVFEVDFSTPDITLDSSVDVTATVMTVDWSPDGKYIAVGTPTELRVYSFAPGIIGTAITVSVGSSVNSVHWSSDGQYIAVGTSEPSVRVYRFDRTALSLVAIPNTVPDGAVVNSIRFIGSGDFIAAGADSTDTDEIIIYQALQFPHKNVIKDNVVYCNSGNACPGGVGISGSSIANLIIGNTAYANPILDSSSTAAVGTNYSFVTNVFNQLFGQGPSVLQNISVDGCVPLELPADLVLLLKQAKFKVGQIDSQLDVVLSQVCALGSEFDTMSDCDATPITSLAAAITSPGFYCLASNLSGTLTISSDDVVVDLNGHKITGGINISDVDQVRIFHGTVEQTGMTGTAISISSATNISLDDVKANNAQIGINMFDVTSGLIENCSMSLNFTGIELNNSHKVVIDNTVASCNKNAGYCLISSTTNCIRNSKALSTGEGNSETSNQTIFGFVSTGGYANIFENCIANGTQGLQVTDYDSLIAGFAFRRSGDTGITEGCSKIIDCESANATSSAAGGSDTVPYGILLEPTITQLTKSTQTPNPVPSADINGVDWSPDGKYLAVGGELSSNLNGVSIYAFNSVTFELDRIARALGNDIPSSAVTEVKWSHDGTFVLAGDSTTVRAYQLCTINNTLDLVATIEVGAKVNSVDWRFNDAFIAFGTDADNELQVYTFDRGATTFTQLATVNVSDTVNSVAWRADGTYIATGLDTGNELSVYEVDFSTPALTLNDSVDVAATATAVDWSPDGKFIAVGTPTELHVYPFEPGTIGAAVTAVVDSSVNSVHWSNDGQYIAIGTNGPSVRVYRFDRVALTLIASPDTAPNGVAVNSVRFIPTGDFIAVGADETDTDQLLLYQALQFPHKNVIKGNTVYCNSGNTCPGGVGISGSSIANLIIDNTAYANPILDSNSTAAVGTNYAFVSNVFNQLFGQSPSALQNISVDGCVPMGSPADLVLLLKQAKQKAIDVQTILDSTESKLCEALSNLDLLSGCDPTPFTAPTIITASGFYCLSESNNSGVITVQANIMPSGVVVDLNGHRVQAVVIEQNDQVTFRNGTVNGNTNMTGIAIDVQSGSTNITLQDIKAQNAQLGIAMTGVVGGLIENCTMSQNVTGVELTSSHKIVIDSCAASCNKNAGYCLISSTTNCLKDCKALSTGEGNNNILDQTVFGFVSTDGNANIFERCIANSTQALSTTDYQSVVAGFALRGSEGCTKIIECESANTQTDDAGVTIPYGILLEASLNNPITLTTSAVPTSSLATTAEWSPDGKYVAAADEADDTITIYEFDYTARTLIKLTSQTGTTSLDLPRSSRWSPDGNYIAVADEGLDALIIYYFDKTVVTLTEVTSIALTGLEEIAEWSPNGSYISVVESTVGSVQIYQFDRVAETLAHVATSSGVTVLTIPKSANWSPDGNYISVADIVSNIVVIYTFNSGSGTLIELTTSGSITAPTTSAWSPNGKYIAVVTTDLGPNSISVYEFNPTVPSLVLVDSITDISTLFLGAEWSPDGKYIAVISQGPALFTVYEFDPGASLLTEAAMGIVTMPLSVRWSPDGQYVAIADEGPNQILIYEALDFPHKNVIKSNVVYCNSGGACPSGIGISGSSIANMIIGNTTYANPINPFMVNQNYAFVTNVFNELFGQGPSSLQNISIGGCEPISMPDDLGLLAKQIKAKACMIDSQVDLILSKISELQNSIIDVASPCAAISISAGPITDPGFYCLSADATGPFAITASNVVLDMNGRKITSGVTISGQDQIKLFNGVIEGTASIDGIAASNSTNITLENVTVKNSLVGVNFNSVVGGWVDQCTLTQNVTGLELDQSAKITIDKTVARCNRNAGYCLISSTTNCFTDCKALSTGEGNNNITDQTVFGFVSVDGYGNIFERCIANSTQALSTTDYQSIVAGFALRGSEGCSKIIDCEAANAQTDASGVTVPYGILLEGSLGSEITLTAFPAIPEPTTLNNSVSWSPDGKLLAAGFGSGEYIQLYSLDRNRNILSRIAVASPQPTANTTDVVWSPNGKFLVTTQTTMPFVRIYEFCSINNELTQVALPDVIPDGTVFPVDWNPNGQFIVIGQTLTPRIIVYKFDPVTSDFTQFVASPDVVPPGSVLSVNWSSDGKFVLAGGVSFLRVYEFDSSSATLIERASPDVSPGSVESAVWSPDGKYIVAGDDTPQVRIYSFDSNSFAFVQVATALGSSIPNDDVLAVDWSGDGRFIVATQGAGSLSQIQVFEFDRGNNTLVQVALPDVNIDPINEDVVAVKWSPDGGYIAVGITGSGSIALYQALSFPHKNVIIGNTVYCNSGGSYPSGVGISGSSIQNMIIGNTAYSNPLSPSVVGSNYQFVTNVFNQLFGQEPTALQNISLDCNQVITAPDDLVLLAKQACAKLVNISACGPTQITSNDVSGGIVSLTAAGNYCLGEALAADLEITGTSIAVDLNDNCLTGDIIISGDDVSVYNGNVIPPAVDTTGPINAGIDILQGANRTAITNLVVDASTAPMAENVGRPAVRISGTDTQIVNCTLTAGFALDATGSNNGTEGGSGIVLRDSALRTFIRDCTIVGGDGADGGSLGGNGGDGGDGIQVQAGSVSQVEISNCLIAGTGVGGAAGLLGSTVGGRGGDGVSIDVSAVGIAVHNCIIRNAGVAGLSATEEIVTVIDLPAPTPDISVIDTADGKAIDDLVTASENLSVIFGNFADTIKNPIVYNLNNRRATPGTDPANGDGGVLVSNPPDATAGGGNVVVNHIVNVFMGTSSS